VISRVVRQPLGGLPSPVRRVGEQVVVGDRLDGERPHHGREEVAAAERGAEPVLLVGEQLRATDRRADPKPFGGADDVGVDVVVIGGPELAGSSDAGLDLVDDERNVVLVGDRADLGHERLAGEPIAADPLDGFEDREGDLLGVDVAAFRSERVAEARPVGREEAAVTRRRRARPVRTEGDGLDSGDLRVPPGVHRLGLGERKGAERAAVEASAERVAVRRRRLVVVAHLDRVLDGLRARVREEDRVVAVRV